MAARRNTTSTIELQAVLRFVARYAFVRAGELIRWMVAAFGCGVRAARDNLTVLVRGGWLARSRDQNDRRRVRYTVTEKGRADMQGTFGRGALKRGRKRYSTCLSGTARVHQARFAEPNPLAEALEAEIRSLFGNVDAAELTRKFIMGGGFGTVRRLNKRSPFRTTLQRELLGNTYPEAPTEHEP